MKRSTLRLFVVLFLVTFPATASAVWLGALGKDNKLSGPFAVFELHGSLLSDASNLSMTAGSFGYGIRGGYRWAGWGVFGLVEHNMWLAPNLINEKVVMGAVNIGVGAELTYAGGFLHTSLAVGPSVLAFDTILDKAGTTGFFLHLRPVGLRFVVHKYLVLILDPISFALIAPVLSGIPLIYTQYRTSFSIEGAF